MTFTYRRQCLAANFLVSNTFLPPVSVQHILKTILTKNTHLTPFNQPILTSVRPHGWSMNRYPARPYKYAWNKLLHPSPTHLEHNKWILRPFNLSNSTDGSKSNHSSAYAYSISGNLTSHRILNISSVFTAKLTAIYSCLSHATQLYSNGKYLFLTDSLPSHHSLLDTPSYNPLTLSTSTNFILKSRSFGSAMIQQSWLQHASNNFPGYTCRPSISYPQNVVETGNPPASHPRNPKRHHAESSIRGKHVLWHSTK